MLRDSAPQRILSAQSIDATKREAFLALHFARSSLDASSAVATTVDQLSTISELAEHFIARSKTPQRASGRCARLCEAIHASA
jgi:hypothetical protein